MTDDKKLSFVEDGRDERENTSLPDMGVFRRLGKRYARIAIAGGPRTGKSTLLEQFAPDRALYHTDELSLAVPWGDQPGIIIRALESAHHWILEGVQVARALRKGLTADLVIYLHVPTKKLTKAQLTMAKGIRTIFKEWRRTNHTAEVFEIKGHPWTKQDFEVLEKRKSSVS